MSNIVKLRKIMPGAVFLFCLCLPFRAMAEPMKPTLHEFVCQLQAREKIEAQQSRGMSLPLSSADCCELLNILAYYGQDQSLFNAIPNANASIITVLTDSDINYYRPVAGQETIIVGKALNPKAETGMLSPDPEVGELYLCFDEEVVKEEGDYSKSDSFMAKQQQNKNGILMVQRSFTTKDPFRKEKWVLIKQWPDQYKQLKSKGRKSENLGSSNTSNSVNATIPTKLEEENKSSWDQYKKVIIPATIFTGFMLFGLSCPPLAFLGGVASGAELEVFFGAVFRDALWETVVALWLINQAHQLPT